jgi:hypothetical protein
MVHAQLEVLGCDPVCTVAEEVTILLCLVKFLQTNLISRVLTEFALF